MTLSAQATDAGVNKATRRLFPVANTPAKILALGEDGLKPYIATIGLFNATLASSEKGFYAMAFLLALFGSVAVQKNIRDTGSHRAEAASDNVSA